MDVLTWNISCLLDLTWTSDTGVDPLTAVFLNIVTLGLVSSFETSTRLASSFSFANLRLAISLFMVSPPAEPTVLALCLDWEGELLDTEHSKWLRLEGVSGSILLLGDIIICCLSTLEILRGWGLALAGLELVTTTDGPWSIQRDVSNLILLVEMKNLNDSNSQGSDSHLSQKM